MVLPSRERRWACEFLRQTIPARNGCLVSVHVRNLRFSPERNLDPELVDKVVHQVCSHAHAAAILVGRDDGSPALDGPNIFPAVAEDWPIERTAALIAQTQLFIGGESALTHVAAALGRPVIGLGFVGHHARPFTKPDRYIYFQKGESPETILAEASRFVKRLNLASRRRKSHG
jgi:ADP-heptose:LPS heptosyltransferase